MDDSFPKFQYSIFTDGREVQFVIRANTFEELCELKKQLDTILPKKAEKAVSQQPEEPLRDMLDSTCPIHNVEMQQKTGKFGNFWSHFVQTPTGNFWCDGKKLKPAKQG